MREPLTREQDLELQRNNGIKENAESDKQVMIWERDDLLKQLAEAQKVAMWTTEKPTVPGWYWYLPVGLPMRPKELFDYNGRLFIRGFEWLDNVTTGEWAGPLEPPKEETSRLIVFPQPPLTTEQILIGKDVEIRRLSKQLAQARKAATTKYRDDLARELGLDHDMLGVNRWTTSQIIGALDRIDMRETREAKETP